MKAVVVRRQGGPEQLRVEEVPRPEPGAGEVLIRVEASGINFIDVYFRRGSYQAPLPFTPGGEIVGTIEALGPGASGAGFVPGDRVAALGRLGGYAQYALAPLDRLIAVNDAPPEHALMLFQAITAEYLAHDVHPIREGEVVLVHSAAGGVGSLLVQYAKAMGASVVGTASSPEKATIASWAGADRVVDAAPQGLAERVRAEYPDGVDVVFDAVGKDTFHESLRATRRRGHVVVYGEASGPAPAIAPGELLTLGSLTLTGSSIYHHIGTSSELRARAATVLADLENGTLRTLESRAFALDDAAHAHALLESRATTGKLYLRVA